jgi:glycosyltransferase involved in cell wall biosynthesis
VPTEAAPQHRPIIVVTPVFEDLEAASMLFRELAAALPPGSQAVVVDDGSVQQPLHAGLMAAAGLRGTVITLRRNVGHQRAIAIGLNYCAEELPAADVLVMDADGEDSPATIAAMAAELAGPGVDLVVARRRSRSEGPVFRAGYAVYKLLFKAATGRAIAFGNFMLMTPAALQRLVAMQELWLHVAASALNSRLRIRQLPLDRGLRYAGSSRMNFVSLALHGFKALMVFAEDVLVRVGIACSAVAVLTVVGIVAAVVLKTIGFATPGWFSVALGIMLLMFMQTGALTLTTLMLAGVVRSGSVSSVAWRDFVLAIETTPG